MKLTEEEIDKLLIDTVNMDDVQVIEYIFEYAFDQAIQRVFKTLEVFYAH